jgi:beta-1,4-N-acetylglucosaminyltransferase
MRLLNNKPRILCVLGGGGHTTELVELLHQLDGKFEFVVDKNDKLSYKKVGISARLFKTRSLRRMEEVSLFYILINFFPSFLSAFKILLKSKSNIILTSGPAIAIPFVILGKILFRKNIIYIETLSRIYSKSISGRMTYLISDLFFIQWKEMKKLYPKAIYAGRLL